jgi:hypothetical protein
MADTEDIITKDEPNPLSYLLETSQPLVPTLCFPIRQKKKQRRLKL